MKKKTSLILWLFAAVFLIGIYRFAIYKIGMYYSVLSAEQLTNDSTYGKLQFQNTATTIASVVLYVGAIFIAYKVVKIFFAKDKTPVK